MGGEESGTNEDVFSYSQRTINNINQLEDLFEMNPIVLNAERTFSNSATINESIRAYNFYLDCVENTPTAGEMMQLYEFIYIYNHSRTLRERVQHLMDRDTDWSFSPPF
jgi:hypothetical protein